MSIISELLDVSPHQRACLSKHQAPGRRPDEEADFPRSLARWLHALTLQQHLEQRADNRQQL